jgi:hypothetical protein
MGSGNPQQEARKLLCSGDISLLRLWVLYWGQGGNADEMSLDAFIHGIPLLDGDEAQILGWALEPLLPP